MIRIALSRESNPRVGHTPAKNARLRSMPRAPTYETSRTRFCASSRWIPKICCRMSTTTNLFPSSNGSSSVASRGPLANVLPNVADVQYWTNWGASKYNSLQAHLQKQPANRAIRFRMQGVTRVSGRMRSKTDAVLLSSTMFMNTFGSSMFGKITTTVTTARISQLSLKIHF